MSNISFPDFQDKMLRECVEGSAIDPRLFEGTTRVISDQEFDSAGDGCEAIAEVLNWNVKTTQKGFSGRETNHALVFENEDGSDWQAKLAAPLVGDDGKPRKYETPKKKNESDKARAYLPKVNREIRRAIAKRYKCEVPPCGESFWSWVEAHPEIPILLTEGGKKSLCLLSLGFVAIAVYGVNSGYCRNDDGTYDLIPDLQRFCQPGREFTICYDKDDKPETVKKVANATRKLGGLLASIDGVSVKVALWGKSQGKGVDDFVVANGAEAWEEVVKNAIDLPMQTLWSCLPTHHYQIGKWVTKDVPIEEVSRLLQASKRNPNIKDCGLTEDGKKHTFSIFQPSCDFDFTVVKELHSEDGGGLVLRVERVEGTELVRKDVYIKSTEISQVRDCVTALKRELKGNVSCTLKPDQLQALIQSRTGRYQLKGGRTYELADRTGQQDDGTWVFENCQFAADGTPITEYDSGWVFNHQLGQEEKIPSPQIAPQNPEALKELVAACQGFFNLETLPLTWFVCGYSIATMQRQAVMQAEGNFPQLALFGDPGGGKTTAAQVATSLAGMHKFVISRFSESMVYETVKSLGGLPLLLDDPVKKGIKKDTREAIDNFLWAMFNGTTRKVRGNEQTPHSNVIVTTNVSLGEDNQALESRLIKLHFAVKPPNSKGYPALKKAMDGASGGLSQLLGIAYDQSAVKDIEARLLEYLPHAHARIASSLALITYFTQQFANTAGITFNAFAYCVSHLCPTANEFESDKDSLQDFLEKLEIMKSQGSVGEWNYTPVTSGGKSYQAVYLAEVWGEFERKFAPNYSRQSLQQLVEGRGGQVTTQKFVATKLEWIDYERAIAEYNRRDFAECEGSLPPPPIRPKKLATRKCLLIPESEVTPFFGVASELEATKKLPDPVELPRSYQEEVTREALANQSFQPKVTRVTQVTEETELSIKKGTRVEVPATGETGLVVELEDDFATIKLDMPTQSNGLGRKFMGCSLAEIRALSANPNGFKVGDRVRYNSQFWDVTKIRADKTLDLDHATLQKATSASPAEVELVGQGVAV